MTLLTPPEARKFACPLARVQGDADAKGNVNGNCRAEKCILWRWRDVASNDPRYISALTREIALLQEEHKDERDGKGWGNDRAHKAAVANISQNIEGYIVRTEEDRGRCGLANA